MLLNNKFLKAFIAFNDKYKYDSFHSASFVIAKVISLESLKPKVIEVHKTEKMNEEMLFKEFYCNQLILN